MTSSRSTHVTANIFLGFPTWRSEAKPVEIIYFVYSGTLNFAILASMSASALAAAMSPRCAVGARAIAPDTSIPISSSTYKPKQIKVWKHKWQQKNSFAMSPKKMADILYLNDVTF